MLCLEDNLYQFDIHLEFENRIESNVLLLCFVKTYIDNTQCEDLLPNHWDSDTLVCERRSGIGHFCHMDHEQCMDPSTGC